MRTANISLPLLRPTRTQPRDEQVAWILWGLLFLTIAAGILAGRTTTVTMQYATASDHWMQGASLYRSDGRGFLYLPQAAILFIPFTLLSHAISEIMWRILTIGVFASGVFRLCRTAEAAAGVRLFLVVSLITIPMACSAARNGQATLIMAGLMMMAVEEIALQNWSRAALLLCIGLAFKPLIVVLMLLVAAIYRPLLGRLLIGVCAVLAIPYLTGNCEYVTSQYVAFGEMLGAATREGTHRPWAHVFGMLQTAGMEVDWRIQTAIRVAAAALTLLAGGVAQRRLPAARCALYLYALAGCYLMLFNPRTENNTYALVAPAIGLFCAEAFVVQRHATLGWLLLLLGAGTVGSYEIGRRLVPTTNPVWLAPLMCVGFAVFVVGRLIGEISREERYPAQPASGAPWGRMSSSDRFADRLAA